MSEREKNIPSARPGAQSDAKAADKEKPRPEVKPKAEERAAKPEDVRRPAAEEPAAKPPAREAAGQGATKAAEDIRSAARAEEGIRAEAPDNGGDVPARKPVVDTTPTTTRAEGQKQTLAETTDSVRATTTRAQTAQQFVERFKAANFQSNVRAVKSVVIKQNPAAGEFVPAGTPVNLDFTLKDSLPVESFNVDKALTDKYSTIGSVLDDLSRGDANARDASAVISKEENTDYRNLAAGDKQRVDKYIQERMGFDPAKDAERARSVYNDMKFIYDL